MKALDVVAWLQSTGKIVYLDLLLYLDCLCKINGDLLRLDCPNAHKLPLLPAKHLP